MSKLIIDNRTGMESAYLLAHLGALLIVGADGLVHGTRVGFLDGVTIDVIENEKSARLIFKRQPLERVLP